MNKDLPEPIKKIFKDPDPLIWQGIWLEILNLLLSDKQMIMIWTEFVEIIKDKYNGILLNKPYSQDLYKTLKNLINNPQIVNNLKKGVTKTIIDSDEKEYEKLILLYKSIAASKNNNYQKD